MNILRKNDWFLNLMFWKKEGNEYFNNKLSEKASHLIDRVDSIILCQKIAYPIISDVIDIF